MNKKWQSMLKWRPTKFIFALIAVLSFLISFLSYGMFLAGFSVGSSDTGNNHLITINRTISFSEGVNDPAERNPILSEFRYIWSANLTIKVIFLYEPNYQRYLAKDTYSPFIEKIGLKGRIKLVYTRPNIPNTKFHILTFVDPEIQKNLSNGTIVKIWISYSQSYNIFMGPDDFIWLKAYDGGLKPLFLYAASVAPDALLIFLITFIISLIVFILFIPLTFLAISKYKKGPNRKKRAYPPKRVIGNSEE